LASNEQDWPADSESAESAAAPSGEDACAGSARPAPPRSVWADMLISGPGDSGQDDTGEPEPPGADQPPAYGSVHEGTLGWPSSGLPPLFGQRPAAGERPSFEAGGLPPAGSPYGGHRPLEPRPEPAGTGLPEPGPAELGSTGDGLTAGLAQPGPGGYGFVSPPAPDLPMARDSAGPEAAHRPWETYKTETGYEPAVGYGAMGPQEEPPAAGPEHGWTGPAAYGAGYPAPDEAEVDPGRNGYGGYGVVPDPGEPSPYYDESPEYGEPSPQYAEGPEWHEASADSLTADLLLPGRHAAPPSGWRRALCQATGGRVRARASTADRHRMDLVLRARTPVAGGHHRVAVLSLKGGVGKTTTTVGLGSTLASLRGDRIIAIDANPDRGTLCDKLRLETAATVRDLLNEENQIRRYADVRAYTTKAASGLEVLASDRDPTVSVAFSDRDYEDVALVLEHYYSASITDCGTGLLHSAMIGVLRLADQIVLVSSPSVDGARSASATLDWLAAHQYGDLVRGAVVVLSAIRPRSKSTVDLARLEQHFAARCRSVVRVPYDAHLEEGAEVDLAQLSRATADAYLVLAAEVGDGFARPRR
jgi:MinD-like ATPase involved in chromosome partitioning or flagellar assembly